MLPQVYNRVLSQVYDRAHDAAPGRALLFVRPSGERLSPHLLGVGQETFGLTPM